MSLHPSNSPTISATWFLLAPHTMAHGQWHAVGPKENAGARIELTTAASRIGQYNPVTVVAPLSRCIIMATNLPLLSGARLQQALAGALGDRLTGGSGAQHFAAASADNGRIREAAICDAEWLRQCLAALTAAGLQVARVVPEAALLPKASAWWGQLESDQPPAWLVRTANGEAVRVAAPMLDAVLSPADDSARKSWQWFADSACGTPAGRDSATTAALSASALLRRGAQDHWNGWDVRQFSFAPLDGTARVLRWGANLLRQRSGRFALGAMVALLVINVLGLNLYAMKQKREITERHAEMERIVAQALPGAPRALEPSLQLETAWQRSRGGAGTSTASLLLGLYAQSGAAQALTSLDVSERTLRAGFSDAAALERSWLACQGTSLRESLRQAGVRCTRDGDRLLLDFSGSEAGNASPNG